MRTAFMSRDRADWLIALSSGCTRSKLQVRGATPALARRRIAHNNGMGQSSLHRALEIRHLAELPGHLLLHLALTYGVLRSMVVQPSLKLEMLGEIGAPDDWKKVKKGPKGPREQNFDDDEEEEVGSEENE